MTNAADARKPPGGTWGPPLVGLAGTIAGILIAFARIGTEPQLTTVLVAHGFSLVVVTAGLIVLLLGAVTDICGRFRSK